MRDATDRTGTEPDDFISGGNGGDAFTELTAQPSGNPTAGGNDDSAMDDAGSESDVVADDAPPVGSLCPLVSGLTPVLFLGCSTFSF